MERPQNHSSYMALVDPRLHNVPDESDGGVNNLERDACDNTSIIASFDQTESQGQNARESVPIAAISITDDAAEGPGSDVLPRLRTSTDGSCEIPIAGVVDTSDSPIQYADATIAVVPENLRQLIFLAHQNRAFDMDIEAESEQLRTRRQHAIQVMMWEARYRRAFMSTILLFLLVMIVARSMGRTYSYVGYALGFFACMHTLWAHGKWKEAVRKYDRLRQSIA